MKLFSTSLLLGAACCVAGGANAALVAHYTFDTDASATVGTDAVLGEAASIDNTNFVAGGGSLRLDPTAIVTDTAGADGAVGGDSFDWSTDDTRTVAFFMRTDGTQDLNATMISLGSGTGAGNRFDIRLSGGALRLEVQSGGTTTASALDDGNWHHVAIVVPADGATVASTLYYIDGVLVGAFGGSGTGINTGAGPLRMGDSYQDTGRDFAGNLDDVRLYDSALTANEIAALAAVPEPGSLALLGLGGLMIARRRRA